MPAPRRRLLWLLLVPFLVVAGLALRGRSATARYATAAVDRGDIAEVVGATGVLQAVITVQVGSQVSGTISALHADFNSRVGKGQVIARLEQSAFLARLNQAQANLASARANVDRSQAAIDDAKQKFDRALALSQQDLVPATDLESARAGYHSALAQLQASRAAVKQAEAALNQAQVDLDHTVITAPVDGVVLARNVDVGQTVAASFQAPVLFVIANDLTRMQVNASISEADIGRVRAGQEVTFTVDAFPEETFLGRLEQVRLQPFTEQNVVTYNTIIAVDNPRLRLMPGMTATVTVVVRKRENALRVPATALRFRPEGFVEAPGATRREAPARAIATRRQRAGRREGPSVEGAEGPRRGRPGLVFVLGADARPEATPIRVGLSDGRYVEIVEGLEEGSQVVTGLASGAVAARPQASGTTNPFSPQRPQPRSR